jgi:hypothetical protein
MKKQTEAKPEVLPAELTQVVNNSKMVITDAQQIAIKFAPYMQIVNDLSQKIASIEKVNPTEEDAKLARQYRLQLVSNRGKNGMDITHTELKANIVVRGRYIDNLYNAVENSSKLSELEAEAIEKHQERQEAKRQADLFESRKSQLDIYGTDTTYLPLGQINEDQFARILENEQLAHQARLDAAEKVEQARVEAEKLAEANRLELERLQAERIEAERLEAIRVKEELAAKEAELAKEREKHAAELKEAQERDRKEAEKLAKENEAKLAEQKRIAEIEAKKQADILAAQKLEAEKLAKELQAKKDVEAKIESDKKVALIAPDKDKINALYLSIKAIEPPDFKTGEAKLIGFAVGQKIKELLLFIKDESQKLK